MTTDSIGYRKTYTIHRVNHDKNTLKVTFPYPVVEREARRRGLTVEQFLVKFKARAEYNGFDGVHYTFIERKGG